MSSLLAKVYPTGRGLTKCSKHVRGPPMLPGRGSIWRGLVVYEMSSMPDEQTIEFDRKVPKPVSC